MPHSYVSLKYHLVFRTKFRLPWITAELEPKLYKHIGGVLRRNTQHRKMTYEDEIREAARRDGIEVEDAFFPEPKPEA